MVLGNNKNGLRPACIWRPMSQTKGFLKDGGGYGKFATLIANETITWFAAIQFDGANELGYLGINFYLFA